MQKPDFIVVGGKVGEGVVLLASTTLSHIQLDEILDTRLLNLSLKSISYPRYDIFLTAKVKDYVVVYGETYAEAWQTLLSDWNPEKPHHIKAIENNKEMRGIMK